MSCFHWIKNGQSSQSDLKYTGGCLQALRTHHTTLYKETGHSQTWLSLGTFVPIFYRHQGKTLLYSWFHGENDPILKESPGVKVNITAPCWLGLYHPKGQQKWRRVLGWRSMHRRSRPLPARHGTAPMSSNPLYLPVP